MSTPLTFRSRLAQGLAILLAVVAVVALVAFVREDGVSALLVTAAPIALVVALGWAVFWRPRVDVSDDGITLVNIARTVHVPWRRFAHADTRWALSVTTTDDDTFSAWAVPAGSGFGARMMPRQSGEMSPAQRKLGSTGSAEAAAMAIADKVRGSAGRPDAVDREAEVTVTTNTTVLAVLGGLAVLSALSVLLA